MRSAGETDASPRRSRVHRPDRGAGERAQGDHRRGPSRLHGRHPRDRRDGRGRENRARRARRTPSRGTVSGRSAVPAAARAHPRRTARGTGGRARVAADHDRRDCAADARRARRPGGAVAGSAGGQTGVADPGRRAEPPAGRTVAARGCRSTGDHHQPPQAHCPRRGGFGRAGRPARRGSVRVVRAIVRPVRPARGERSRRTGGAPVRLAAAGGDPVGGTAAQPSTVDCQGPGRRTGFDARPAGQAAGRGHRGSRGLRPVLPRTRPRPAAVLPPHRAAPRPGTGRARDRGDGRPPGGRGRLRTSGPSTTTTCSKSPPSTATGCTT